MFNFMIKNKDFANFKFRHLSKLVYACTALYFDVIGYFGCLGV